MNCLSFRLASSSTIRISSTVTCLKSRYTTRRGIHKRITLPYTVEGGLGAFLPPDALKTVAVDYQDGLLQRLDEEVRGTPEENQSVAQTVLNTASHRERTLAFNYASLALNNSFFLDQLKPPPPEPRKNHQHEISNDMAASIRFQYGSLVQLKSAFSSAVTGMFTSGYVWFVTDKHGNCGIIPTFGPGTLLIRSRTYMGHSKSIVLGPDLLQYDSSFPYDVQEEMEGAYEDQLEEEGPPEEDDLDDDHFEPLRKQQPPSPPTGTASPPPGVNPTSPASGVSSKQPPTPSNILHPRFLHTSRPMSSLTRTPDSVWAVEADNPERRTQPRSKVEMLNIGEVLHPLFCISVNEHAWMSAGYGVWGKEEWLKQFWTVLDWEKVSKAYAEFNKPH